MSSTDSTDETAATARADGFLFKYFLSVCAATVAETATYPLDLTKTRLQIQGEADLGTKTQYRGMLRTAFGIAKEEGFLKLWQGVTPAIYRHIVYSGCRMSFYEWIRDHVLKGKTPDGKIPFWKSCTSGVIGGSLAQFLASPTDLIKVQIQMEGKRRLLGQPPRVRGTWHAFTMIYTEGGIRGLWKGWVPNVQRAALVNLGDLTTYDTTKQWLLTNTTLKDNSLTHGLSSVCSVNASKASKSFPLTLSTPAVYTYIHACAGVASAVLGTPADVIKTRIMNQEYVNGKGALYKGSIDCLMKTVKLEGFLALYKGFFPIWMRMAPWSMTFWLSYEQIRRFAGTKSF